MERIRAVEVTGEVRIPVREKIEISATTDCVEAMTNKVEKALLERITEQLVRKDGCFDNLSFKFVRSQ